MTIFIWLTIATIFSSAFVWRVKTQFCATTVHLRVESTTIFFQRLRSRSFSSDGLLGSASLTSFPASDVGQPKPTLRGRPRSAFPFNVRPKTLRHQCVWLFQVQSLWPCTHQGGFHIARRAVVFGLTSKIFTIRFNVKF